MLFIFFYNALKFLIVCTQIYLYILHIFKCQMNDPSPPRFGLWMAFLSEDHFPLMHAIFKAFKPLLYLIQKLVESFELFQLEYTRITIVLLYPATKVLTQFYINLINLSVDIFSIFLKHAWQVYFF